jgi:TolB-like protein/Tfp pilus assembly protein PilF
VNLYTEELGNPSQPTKFQNAARSDGVVAKPRKLSPALIVILSLIALAIVSVIFAPAIMKVGTPLRDVRPDRTDDGHPGAASVRVTEKSIAVLPFENLSRDPDNAYFAEGIQDEILTRLSKVATLKVISRTSTQKYKSAPDNLRDVGKQLGVANLLEGSVQKIANAVHINVQLIRAATDEHLWAESYNRKLDDVFGVEGEVATAIADQLNAKLTGAEQKAIADKPTQNAAAYDAYLRGVSLETVGINSQDAQQVASFFAQAVQLDPNFALAWARLALTRSYLYFNGVEPSSNSGAAVKEAADRAIALQPELGEAWLAQGVYRYRVLRDFNGALQAYQESLKRLPNSALVFEQMGHVERRLGQDEAAQKHYQMAAQLDPRNLKLLFSVADVLESARRFAEVDAIYDRILQISPGNEAAYAAKAFNFQSEGKLSEAAKELSKIAANSRDDSVVLARYLQFFYERKFNDAIALLTTPPPPPIAEDPRTMTGLGFCQLFAGRTNDARATFQRAIATMKPSPDGTVPIDARMLPSFLAWCYAGLGEKEKALGLARQGVADYENDVLARPFTEQVLAEVQAHFGDLDSAFAALPHLLEVPNGVTVGDLRVDPFWDPLRKDPRFQKLCQEQQK